MVEVREPVRRLDQRRAVPAQRVGEAGTVGRAAEPDGLGEPALLPGRQGAARAPDAYREALAVVTDAAAATRLRVRLAKVSVAAGDLATAGFALEGLEPDGRDDAADAELLLVRGQLHLFGGDLAAAEEAADLARRSIALTPRSSVAAFDLVTFDGLLAHMRGEWFPRLQAALHRGVERPELVGGIFDSHLCVAEYLLYGPTPYKEVLELARGLRESAERAGVRRVVAFATALEGEAALLAGHLDEAARALSEAADLHRRTGSTVGEAHSLQRLAEVHLADGDPVTARGLLIRALPLARWTMLAPCLLPRVYGSRIVAAGDDVAAARAVVDEAVAALGPDDTCALCSIMLDVPAARACADAGDVDAARRHLEAAEVTAARWRSLGWEAAVLEARAHVAAAEDRADEAAGLWRRAAEAFTLAGQPLDARRRRSAGGRAGSRPGTAGAAESDVRSVGA